MAKKTPWGLIILGIASFVVIVGVALVAVAGYFIYQQFAFQAASKTRVAAEAEFDAIVREFEGQKPFIDVVDGEPVVHKGSDVEATEDARPLKAIHVVVWDPNEEKMIRLNIPFWLLRMTKGKPIKLSSGDEEFGGEPFHLNVTAEDLERHGPGLILDHRESSGQRVLVWAR
ncbi:MAG: hypothetical protein AB1806_09885 [Acidobacteriota bacterium]